MEDNRPSATEMRVALRRAAHQLLDDPRLLDDPLAIRIVGSENAAALQADPVRFEDSKLSPRSRFVKDELPLAYFEQWASAMSKTSDQTRSIQGTSPTTRMGCAVEACYIY
jgi:hypothetical protein